MKNTAKNIETFSDLKEKFEAFHKAADRSSTFDIVVSPDLTIVAVEPNVLTWEFQVKRIHCNQIGKLHGGCAATLIDICSSFGILTAKHKPWKMIGVSTNLSVTFMRAVPEDSTIRIVCELQHIGKTLANIYTKILDQEGRVCYTGSHTKFNIDAQFGDALSSKL